MPFQEPAGGPNFFPFDDNVRYEIHIDNNGDGKSDVSYDFRFKTRPKATNFAGIPTFLYNDGPITSLTDPNWLVPQTYNVDRNGARIASNVLTPPANVGPRSTPDYAGPRGHRGQDARRRHQGLRRPARRPVLRRPRLDLRPGRPAAAQRAACHPAAGRGRHRWRGWLQYEHHRAPDPDPAADQGPRPADRPERPQRRPRRVGRGQPPEGQGAQLERHHQLRPARGSRSRGWATPSSTR